MNIEKIERKLNEKNQLLNQKYNNYLTNLDSKITKVNEEIKLSTNQNQSFANKIKIVWKLKSKRRKFRRTINYKIGTTKTEIDYLKEQIYFIDSNLNKIEQIKNRLITKEKNLDKILNQTTKNLSDKNISKKEITKYLQNLNQIEKIKRKNKTLRAKINKIEQQNIIRKELLDELNAELETFDYEELIHLQFEIEKINSLREHYQNGISKVENKILNLNEKIDVNNKLIVKKSSFYPENVVDNFKNQKIIIDTKNEMKKIELELSQYKKQILSRETDKKIKIIKLNFLENYLQNMSIYTNVDINQIASQENKTTRIFNTVEKVLLKDWFFIIIVGILSAGVVLATHLYITNGVGALNEIFVVVMLKNGLETGDYSATIGFASGFLLSRILEGPLVGVLDVGGSILSGVGIGIPAVFLSTNKIAWMMYNPLLALIIGLVTGIIIGIIIIVIRILKPKDVEGLGTDIMIGAGNQTGKFLGPLVIFSAAMYNPFIGIGAGIGAGGFMWIKKPMVGGAIIGAMLFGIVPAFLV